MNLQIIVFLKDPESTGSLSTPATLFSNHSTDWQLPTVPLKTYAPLNGADEVAIVPADGAGLKR